MVPTCWRWPGGWGISHSRPIWTLGSPGRRPRFSHQFSLSQAFGSLPTVTLLLPLEGTGALHAGGGGCLNNLPCACTACHPCLAFYVFPLSLSLPSWCGDHSLVW